MTAPTANASSAYPARLQIDYPDRELDRVSTLLRIFYVIPIAIVLAAVSGGSTSYSIDDTTNTVVGAGGILFLGPLLMIVFRQKYPRWWFDWNLQLSRFSTRVGSYFLVMSDEYPSTDEQQNVHLELDYPEVKTDLNRWLPLVKWFLVIPHLIALVVLGIGAFFAVIYAWFVVVFTGRYPRGVFDYVEGVLRWGIRVEAYAFILITDRYPPFSLD